MTLPTTQAIPASRRRAIARRLLDWYARNWRKLPWRRPPGDDRLPDPYHILLSEAMLQQTQVATVIDYFHRFLERFPTLADLAAADEQDVLAMWQGLGYYRRARNLHRAAKTLVHHHDGKLPPSVDQLRHLPGVGRYTAGALASIALGQPQPLVDGNVARVLARLFAIHDPIDDRHTLERTWTLAAQLVPDQHPGDYNQALMELGATLCTPRAPQCLLCPLRDLCQAQRQQLAEQLPRRLPRRRPTIVHHHVLAIHRRKRWLFQRRPDTGLWAGMWQLPTFEQFPARPAGSTLQTSAQHSFGLTLAPPDPRHSFTHQTTHRTIHFHLWLCPVESGRLRPRTALWRLLTDLADLPLPNPQRRIVDLLRNHDSHQ